MPTRKIINLSLQRVISKQPQILGPPVLPPNRSWPGPAEWWVFFFFALLCVCVCMLMSMCIALSIHTYVRTCVHDDAHVTDIVTCEYYAVCHVNCVYNDNRIIAMPCHTFIHFSKWGDLNCALFEKNVPKESTSYDTRTDGRTVVSSCISKLRT